DRQQDLVAGPDERHFGTAAPGMAGDVSQRFLGDAVNAEGGVPWQAGRHAVGLVGDRNAFPLLKMGTLGTQRVYQAEVFKDRRVQLAREAVYLFGQFDQLFPRITEGVGDRAGEVELLFELADLDGHHGQPLRQVVVDLTGEAAPLDLLSADQPAGQVP